MQLGCVAHEPDYPIFAYQRAACEGVVPDPLFNLSVILWKEIGRHTCEMLKRLIFGGVAWIVSDGGLYNLVGVPDGDCVRGMRRLSSLLCSSSAFRLNSPVARKITPIPEPLVAYPDRGVLNSMNL